MRTGLVILAWVVASLAEGSAFAQTSSLFGSSGPRGQSSGSASTSASGSTGTGGSGGLATGGMSATVSRSPSGGGAGGGGAIQQPQLNQLGQLSSQAVGNGTGFVGLTNQAFVGNRMAGTGGTSMMQPSFGALGGGRGGSDFNQNGGSQGSSSSRPFRPQYRVGFEYRPPSGDLARRAEVQADRLRTSNPALSGLQIDVNDQGIAEIRGEAPTQDARMLIENLVRLEPGIREVTNLVEVVVTPPSATNP